MTEQTDAGHKFIDQWIGKAHPDDFDELRTRQIDRLLEPDFEGATKVHDWRNHVGDSVRTLWHEFTLEQRAAIAIDAEARAESEEWD